MEITFATILDAFDFNYIFGPWYTPPDQRGLALERQERPMPPESGHRRLGRVE